MRVDPGETLILGEAGVLVETIPNMPPNRQHMSNQPVNLTDQSAPVAADRVPAYSWYALAVLTLVYVLNFLDRTLIYILFTPIKKEMAFTDL